MLKNEVFCKCPELKLTIISSRHFGISLAMVLEAPNNYGVNFHRFWFESFSKANLYFFSFAQLIFWIILIPFSKVKSFRDIISYFSLKFSNYEKEVLQLAYKHLFKNYKNLKLSKFNLSMLKLANNHFKIISLKISPVHHIEIKKTNNQTV